MLYRPFLPVHYGGVPMLLALHSIDKKSRHAANMKAGWVVQASIYLCMALSSRTLLVGNFSMATVPKHTPTDAGRPTYSACTAS
jgi:hypothetical protein